VAQRAWTPFGKTNSISAGVAAEATTTGTKAPEVVRNTSCQ
jgi:hypothetical protein